MKSECHVLYKKITINEFEEIELPDSLLGDDGYVNAFSQALERDYFSVRLKRGKLVFQAGGYVGTIQINNNVVLDIRPKVPIKNLDHILFNSGDNKLILSIGNTKYDTAKFATNSMSEFLWQEFLLNAEIVNELGLLKVFNYKTDRLNTPRGKISPLKTKLIHSKSGSVYAHCSWSERSIDNAPNRMIKFLLVELHNRIKDNPDKKLKRRVSYCLSRYDFVPYDHARTFLDSSDVIDVSLIPQTKDYYFKIISIGKLLLENKGLSFRTINSVVDASSLLFSMEVIFENYIRETLVKTIKKNGNSKIRVLDGNKGGGGGAKKNLLNRKDHHNQINKVIVATPDALIVNTDVANDCNVVIDMKYKVIREIADRNDINQIISYAASYGSRNAVLIFPASGSNNGMVCLGEFNGIGIFQYFYNLSNARIEDEELLLSQAMLSLFND